MLITEIKSPLKLKKEDDWNDNEFLEEGEEEAEEEEANMDDEDEEEEGEMDEEE